MAVKTGLEIKKAFAKGLQILAEVAGATMGAKGQTILIEQGQYVDPIISKDGITVAEHVFLEDTIEDQAIQLAKSASRKTNDTAGDGTTATIVLTNAIFKEGMKLISSGYNPTNIKKGIDLAVAQIVEHLDEQTQPVSTTEDIKQVASISANNAIEIGEIIAEAMEEVGKEGVITVEESGGLDTKLSITEGMEFDRGFVSPAFVTDPVKMKANFQSPFIMLVDGDITTTRPILELLEAVAIANKPILLVCDTLHGEALRSMIHNNIKGLIKFCCVKSPGYGISRTEYLFDIAATTGATVVSEKSGLTLEKIKMEHLGQAKSIIIDKDSTVIVEGKVDPVAFKERVAYIRSMIADETSSIEKEKLQERLAKLVGGIAVINVGGATEAEMVEKKHRIEDALCATRAAIEEGVVSGGGVALLEAAEGLYVADVGDEILLGVKVVRDACKSPIRTICENARENSAEVIIAGVLSRPKGTGYDVVSEGYVLMTESGIIDPKKVTRCALQNAASIANLLLGTAGIVTMPEEIK